MKKELLAWALALAAAFPSPALAETAAPAAPPAAETAAGAVLTPGQAEEARQKALEEEAERSRKYGASLSECLRLSKDNKKYEDLSPLPPVTEPMEVLDSMVLGMADGRVKSVNMVLRRARKAKDAAKVEVGKPTLVFYAVDTDNADVKNVQGKELSVAIEFVGAHRRECSRIFSYVLRCYIHDSQKDTYECVDAEDLARKKVKIDSLEDFLKAPRQSVAKGGRDWKIAELIFHKPAAAAARPDASGTHAKE